MPLPDHIIDRFADILLKDHRAGDWRALSQAVSGAAQALQQIRETRDPTIGPDNSLPSIVGAAILRLSEPEVDNAMQASLWMLSDRSIHRARGEAWLHAHPAERKALERDVADEHAAVILTGRSVQGETERMVPPLPPRRIAFRAVRDEEAGVWSATSDDHITAEAPSRAELLDRLKIIVPDLLESRDGRTGPLTLVVDWQEMTTVDQSTLAIA